MPTAKPIKNLVSVGARIAAAVLVLAAPAAWAQGGAHTHGVVRANVALQGALLELELELPQEAVLGFEHRPKTPDQQRAAAAAMALLKDPAKWLQPAPAAGCVLRSVDVQAPMLDAATALPSKEPPAKGAQPKAAKAPEPAHADVELRARFDCAAPAQLSGLELLLMQHFVRIQSIEVNLALDGGQRLQKLKRSKPAAATLAPSERSVLFKR